MKKLIRFQTAVNLSLLLFGLFAIFHLVIILGILLFDYVPIDYLWGGRMQTKEQLMGFELISLFLMLFCTLLVLIKSRRIKAPGFLQFATVLLWILFVLFTLNTVGNVFAKTTFEKFFAIVTAILAMLFLRLGLEKNQLHK